MQTKTFLVLAAALIPLGCSSSTALKIDGGAQGEANGGHAGTAGGFGGNAVSAGGADASQQNLDDALIVPQGLPISLEEGGAGVFDLYALTLRDEPDGLVLYAALKNTDSSTTPACDAALRVTLYDKSNQPIGMFINGLYTSHFYLYTLPDNSTTVASCASPGDIAMTQIDTMATDITVADVGSIVYYYSYFALDSVLLAGLTVSQVTPVTTSAGTSYTGTVINQMSTTVSQPSVAVFPVNSVGRPLGIAKAGDDSQVPAGGSWTFQTTTVDMAGVNYAAFPSASFSN